MKALRIFIMAALLSLQFVSAKGSQADDDGIFTPIHAIDTYVDAMVRGKLNGFNAVIDESAKFIMLIGKNRLNSLDKKQMLTFMNIIKNTELDCTVSTGIIQNTPDMVVAKVDMKFETFTRSNYVSMANTHNGWKIINVYSVFTQLK